MDLATLKKLKPAAYEDAADGYRATGEMAGKAKDAVDTRISSGMRAQLEGEAATAALNELKELSKNFHYVQTECGLVSTALNGFAHDMAAAKRKLDAAVADAQAAGCTVNPDGSVGFPQAAKRSTARSRRAAPSRAQAARPLRRPTRSTARRPTRTRTRTTARRWSSRTGSPMR